MRKKIVFFVGALAAASALVAITLHKSEPSRYVKRSKAHQYAIKQAGTLVGFNLVDPEQAPTEIRESVLHGYSIITNTPFYAPNYAKNHLSCVNCHFCGGDTLGGKNNGISLVGVTTHYPSYSKRDKKNITIKDRISNCFKRSMNGIAPPENSAIMNDIVNYLEWISKEVSGIKNIPWLGLKFLKSDHKPNIESGKKIYYKYCASCHGNNGEGSNPRSNPIAATRDLAVPPVWGPYSFNDGAGLDRIEMLSSFIYYNMPYQDAHLDEEQSLDVAGFITEQSRPEFDG